MKKFEKIRVYAWVEFVIWLIIVALCVFCFKYHQYKQQKQFKSYQIFMNDVDGLIVGSPVRFLGVQIGHVTKIQVISSEIYIKFIITQKGLSLPIGAIATVEGSGLGGSKSLEIYPPVEENSDKIIISKDSTRLGKVLSLFNVIFKDLEEILTNIDRAGREISDIEIPLNTVIPDEGKNGFVKIDKKLDELNNIDKNFKKQVKSIKLKNEGVNNEFGQSKNNK